MSFVPLTAGDCPVGVVMATRNRRDGLLVTLSRLEALSDRPPVVVVDNGSDDGTADTVRRRHPRVRVVALPSNIGAGARNVGAHELATRYIAFADDDSWWSEGALRTAATLFRNHPRCALIAARVLLGPDEHPDPICAQMAASPIISELSLPGPPVLGFLACAAIVRRDAFLEAGGFESRLGIGGEEQLLAIDLARRGWGLAYVDRIVAHHWPSPVRDPARRRRVQARNSLWTAWLRRAPATAWARTREAFDAARRDTTARAALLEALRGLPWVLRKRERIRRPSSTGSRDWNENEADCALFRFLARASVFDLLDIRLGAEARRHIERGGLRPEHITCMPAAAGGPKGLALLPFDRLFAREWLPRVAALELIGASIGAWRMASLAQADPLAALDRLQQAYVRDQNYDERPSPAQVAAVCRGLAKSVFGARTLALRAGVALSVIAARARGAIAQDSSKRAFGRVALVNAASRRWLANHMERVVFHAGAASKLPPTFDAFGLRQVPLTPDNVEDALLASGSIPLVCDPVRNVPAAPPGNYWDGGLIDYHLLLPYDRFDGLVLYPHFVPYVTPGWLDKFLPWRKRPRRHHWLANVVLIAPSRAMLDRLPNRKLPDRNDFYAYGRDHAGRVAAWERAIAESERFAEAALRWLEAPDLSVARAL